MNKNKVIIFGGPPSSGKSRAILWFIACMEQSSATGVAKVDCQASNDDELFTKMSIPSITLLAKDMCPDHFLLEHLPDIYTWAEKQGLTTIIIETAGLCGRCSPYLAGSVNICVIDCTAGMHAPAKLGPLLNGADSCVLTKGDLISPTEREVFASRIKKAKASAGIIWLNGVTGEGQQDLVQAIMRTYKKKGRRELPQRPLGALPQMYCTYCFGNELVDLGFPQQGVYAAH